MKKKWKAEFKKLLPHKVDAIEYDLILDTLAEILYTCLCQQDHKSYQPKNLNLQGVSAYGN